jgi:hypothetical protein
VWRLFWPVLVSARTSPGQVCQAERIVEIPEREQSSVGRDLGAMEFQLQAGIERDAENGIAFFTRCTVHVRLR